MTDFTIKNAVVNFNFYIILWKASICKLGLQLFALTNFAIPIKFDPPLISLKFEVSLVQASFLFYELRHFACFASTIVIVYTRILYFA